MNELILKDKVVVITGGTGVLGKYIALYLAKNGAKLAVLGRSQTKADQIAEEIIANGGVAIGISTDVCDRESLQKSRQFIEEKLGKADILINAAGGNHPDGITQDEIFDSINPTEKDFFALKMDGIKDLIDLNFLGTLLPIQVFAKDMIGRKDCSVINVSSISSLRPLTKVPAYSAAKSAINNLTQSLAIYFAKEGIRVNAVAPGFFISEQNRTLLTNEDGSFTARGEKVINNTPMGRFGNPEDLLSTFLWLCNPESRFVTGIIVPVDGGFNAFSGV